MIGQELRSALTAAAATPVLLAASDYDGTISPLVDDPSAAFPHVRAVDLLSELALLPNVIVVLISGRSLEQLETLVGHRPGIRMIGTHGAEASDSSADPHRAALVQEVCQDLRRVALAFEGTVLEEKPAGAALHYRHAVDPEGAAAAARSVGAARGTRIIDGKLVVELLIGEGDKGSAVNEMRRRHGADRVVFFGDDTTDEDVFLALEEGDVGVKVGEGPTAAQYRVNSPDEVAEALSILHHARPDASG